MHWLYLLYLSSTCFIQSESFVYSYLRQWKPAPLSVLPVDGRTRKLPYIRHTCVSGAGTAYPTDKVVNDIDCSSVSSVFSDSVPFECFNIGKVLGAHGVRGDVKLHLSSEYGGSYVRPGSKLFLKNETERTLCSCTVARSRMQGSASEGIHLVRFENVHTRTAAEGFSKCNIYVEEQLVRKKLQENEYMVRDLVGLFCYHIRDFESVMTGLAASENIINEEGTNIRTDPSSAREIQPLARVVGVVPPDELCSDPTVVHLMHAQLELQVFPSITQTKLKPLIRSMRRKTFQDSSHSGRSTGTPVSAVKDVGGSINCVLMPMVPSIVPVVDIKRGFIFLDPPDGLLDLTYKVKVKPQISDLISVSIGGGSPTQKKTG